MHTAIPKDELDVFKSLPDIKIVFDVGARDDVDYLIIKPDIELHAFEPNPKFFEELTENIGGRGNVTLNNFALGDVEGTFSYNDGSQSIGKASDSGVLVKRLDSYVKEHVITHIDFLKIDTEGYELNVLKGAGTNIIEICRYIQYEKNGIGDGEVESMIKECGFTTHYIGGRNVLCVRDGERVPPIPEPQEGGLVNKSAANYFA